MKRIKYTHCHECGKELNHKDKLYWACRFCDECLLTKYKEGNDGNK